MSLKSDEEEDMDVFAAVTSRSISISQSEKCIVPVRRVTDGTG